jgi:hypothetical protein
MRSRRSPDSGAGMTSPPTHQNRLPRISIPDSAQHKSALVKNRCDQRRWLAGKYNALYSDKVAVTDSDGGSIAGRLAKMSAAERSAWAAEVAAQARALLEAPTIDHEDR